MCEWAYMSPLPSQLAIVTGEFVPELSKGGQRLKQSLPDRGIESEPVLWNDATVEWAGYDAVLVRSCWVFPEDRGRFRSLLGELEHADRQVCNPRPVLGWNLHKRYLTELADAGVRIPPTAVIDQGTDTALETVLADRGWDDVVVKPVVGPGLQRSSVSPGQRVPERQAVSATSSPATTFSSKRPSRRSPRASVPSCSSVASTATRGITCPPKTT